MNKVVYEAAMRIFVGHKLLEPEGAGSVIKSSSAPIGCWERPLDLGAIGAWLVVVVGSDSKSLHSLRNLATITLNISLLPREATLQ